MAIVRLLGVGPHPAKPASELVVGEEIIYHYGYAHEIVAIKEVDSETLLITVLTTDGDPFERQCKKGRLVPWRVKVE